MSIIKDYAKTEHMNSWLRHPVLGDPSFDTFQRIGTTVHVSEPPYEWSVNGSFFIDFDGTWYCYPGLYHYGYGAGDGSACHFKIYRSKDEGQTWEDLGFGMDEPFLLEGDPEQSYSGTDVVLCYDDKAQKYLLTCMSGYAGEVLTEDDNSEYANLDDNLVIENNPFKTTGDGGVTIALADSPAGPFVPIAPRACSGKKAYETCGKYGRFYVSNVISRKSDYIAFILTDSAHHFAWALTVVTAPSINGPWSKPHVILSCDRPEYFPCPIEFYPVEVHDGIAYASATSVAMNRNYQAVFEAPIEEAHDASAWKMTADGNVWHSEDHPHEYYGIWGQTFHGAVEPGTGRYVVMFPSKDARDYGTIGVKTRQWDIPHSDGFTMTGHAGPAISTLLTSYKDFTLDAEFTFKGTLDIAFAYDGILGPDNSNADSVPADTALRNYSAVRMEGKLCEIISIAVDGTEKVYARTKLSAPVTELKAEWKAGKLSVSANGTSVCENLDIPEAVAKVKPLALVLQKFSRIDCSKLAVEGDTYDYELIFNAIDAMLGAGQLRSARNLADPTGELKRDIWHRIPNGYVGEGLIAAKWNVIGNSFELPLQKNPVYGSIGIWIDGIFYGSEKLKGEGCIKWKVDNLKMGPHAVRVAPLEGRIAITQLIVRGNREA